MSRNAHIKEQTEHHALFDDRIIVALDCDCKRAYELTDQLMGTVAWVKVGMTLYYQEGPRIVRDIKERGYQVFLDLKVHDIPFQVEGAVFSAACSGADIISIHGLGGAEMLRAARRGVERAAEVTGKERCKLLGISILTSMDEEALSAVGIEGPINAAVLRLAKLISTSGADGVVCSPHEVAALREALGPRALLVTPGIRLQPAEGDDQSRVATAEAAFKDGASLVVIGRPITHAEDPVCAACNIISTIL